MKTAADRLESPQKTAKEMNTMKSGNDDNHNPVVGKVRERGGHVGWLLTGFYDCRVEIVVLALALICAAAFGKFFEPMIAAAAAFFCAAMFLITRSHFSGDEKSLHHTLDEEDLNAVSQNTEQESGEAVLDIGEDQQFAQWVQMFSMYATRFQEPNAMQFYRMLKQELLRMGIVIYDQLQYTQDGEVVLPPEDSFLDGRESDAWTEVLSPPVYTKEKVLAAGQLR